jgi:hypothetical protein
MPGAVGNAAPSRKEVIVQTHLIVGVAGAALVLAGLSAAHAGPRLSQYSGPLAYGLEVIPPWADGGKLVVNLPEHLEYDTMGKGILRHNDKEPRGHWQVAADGMSAVLDVASPTAEGVRVKGTAKVVGEDRIELSMRITNDGPLTMPLVEPLYCYHYRQLTGFPQYVDNFKHVYTILGGKPVALADIPARKPDTQVRGATVIGCPHKDNLFAEKHGGEIEPGIDAAISGLTDLAGKRKMVIAWTPGRSLLSNASIPCLHADPFYGTIAPGESKAATGLILFTEQPLEPVMMGLREQGYGAYPGTIGAR